MFSPLKSNRFLLFLLFLSTIGVYSFTTAPTVTMEDSAFFLITAKYAGVAHPPGYPLYILIGKLFSLLPFQNTAYSIHFLNILLGSLGVIVLYQISHQLLVSIQSKNKRLLVEANYLFWYSSVSYWTSSFCGHSTLYHVS